MVRSFHKRDRQTKQDVDEYYLERYRLPDNPGNYIDSPVARQRVKFSSKLVNVQFAEMRFNSTVHDDSIFPLVSKDDQPPPLAIYFRRENALDLACIWPLAYPSAPPSPPPSRGKGQPQEIQYPELNYVYDLHQTLVHNLQGPLETRMGSLRVLPGSTKALMYGVPKSYIGARPPVSGLYGYAYHFDDCVFLDDEAVEQYMPEFFAENANSPEVHMTVDEWRRRTMVSAFKDSEEARNKLWPKPRQDFGSKRNLLASIQMHPTFMKAFKKGISAIAWDEDTGRVCITTSSDRQLYVLDFGCHRKPGEYFLHIPLRTDV